MTRHLFSTFLPCSSFKEDSYLSFSLTSSQLKSLKDLKHLISSFSPSFYPLSTFNIFLLLFSDRSDVILLKFLHARNLNPSLAQSMLLRCSSQHSSFNADTLATAFSDELSFKDLESLAAFMHGQKLSATLYCYNAYGLFKDKLIYDRVFGDTDKLSRFLCHRHGAQCPVAGPPSWRHQLHHSSH
ncbi:CRAL/TRIO N-terminal domain-containing protein [Dioscorea alata]|uniref:CRAL/TRIO N-terminal domain-containing protein n=1 Tax=Dioscorea alata TaxID=55571 RepID=A0ACB7V1G3_DIOAL|nr:CRAL/TRIO N-terminal domain-containing protein [Dioscorea alata]